MKVLMHKQCSCLYGFKLERSLLAINAADENRHSTGTLEDAIRWTAKQCYVG